jgi:predicted RecB family nuclease
MAFPANERATLLAVKGVGPTVVDRLEQIGIDSLAALTATKPEDIVAQVAAMLGASCWKNSPQARRAIADAVAAARHATGA